MAEQEPRLKPLLEWVCDHCRQIIHGADDGWMEWLTRERDSFKASSFRIVHSPQSPSSRPCNVRANHDDVSDGYLTEFTGDWTMPRLLSFIDPAPHESNYSGPELADLREWVEVARRLSVPYYEEARQYWDSAREDGFFEELSELKLYLPEELKELIRRYGD